MIHLQTWVGVGAGGRGGNALFIWRPYVYYPRIHLGVGKAGLFKYNDDIQLSEEESKVEVIFHELRVHDMFQQTYLWKAYNLHVGR